MVRILLALICFSFLATPAQAAEFETDSTLRAVSVYTNRAMLTRQAVVSIPAGSHTVVLKNLPANIMTDTLRAEGKASVDVKFGALAHKMIAGRELIAPREKELNDQLESLQDKRKVMEAEKRALTARQNFLDTLGRQAAARSQEDIADINLKPDQWAAAGQVIYGGVVETLKAQLAQDIAIRDIDRQITKVRTELGQLRTGQRNSYQVTLPVESATATKLTIDLSYQVPGVSWRPLYDARLDTKKETLELTQYGSVRQTTGEDWTDVALTLSTAQPQRGAGLPALSPLWVNLYDEQIYKERGAPEARRMMAQKSVASMEMDTVNFNVSDAMLQEPKKKVARFNAAVIDTGGFVSEYHIPGPSTVKADGTETKLMIGAFDTDNELRIQVKPQLSTEAYLVAHTKLKGESPILAGRVSLFRDGAFIGQAHLPLLRPGQENDLAFGIDDQVSVRRQVMKDQRSEAGVLSKDSVLERRFVTEIENLHKEPVDIYVLETMPTSKDKAINIDVIANATTSGYEKDVDKVVGLLRWKMPLTAKQKKDVKLGWKVSWPKDKSLSGL